MLLYLNEFLTKEHSRPSPHAFYMRVICSIICQPRAEDIFFEEQGIKESDDPLKVDSGSHADMGPKDNNASLTQ